MAQRNSSYSEKLSTYEEKKFSGNEPPDTNKQSIGEVSNITKPDREMIPSFQMRNKDELVPFSSNTSHIQKPITFPPFPSGSEDTVIDDSHNESSSDMLHDCSENSTLKPPPSINRAISSSEICLAPKALLDSECKVIRTTSKTFLVRSCSIPDFETATTSPAKNDPSLKESSDKHTNKPRSTNELSAISSSPTLDDNQENVPQNKKVHRFFQPSGKYVSIDTMEKDKQDSTYEFYHLSCLAHPLSLFTRKIHDVQTHKRAGFFDKEKSKSITLLSDDPPNNDSAPSAEKPSIFSLPSFPFSIHKEKNLAKNKHPDAINSDTPSSTPLLVPREKSGAPAIFLFENTPENSPSNTPMNTPDKSMASMLEEESQFETGPKCIEDVLLLKKAARLNSECGEEEEEGVDESGKESRKKSVPKVNFRCLTGFKKHVWQRPTIQIQSPGTAIPEIPENHSLPRRSSMLSVAMPTRRPSMASLLSVSPSVSLAGRRFSFTLGSRSDQMVSLSFKSLENFVNDGNLDGLRSFLSFKTVVIDDRDENGASILLHCAAKGKAGFCKELLSHGADVNAEDNDQWTALITAAKEGHHEVVSTLLEFDAAIDHRDLGGWTAFMWACYKGHLETAKVLLAHGADPNAQGQHHMTGLVWASGRGHTEIVKMLVSKGAKVNMGDKFGTTPLIWACRKGYVEIADELLSHGANVDATGMYSWTPLIVATKGNYIDLVTLLLEHKPNVNALDKDGGTALTIACKEGYSEISSALLRAGAYVNIQDRNGDSNLIYAARGGHKGVVEALLKKHVDIDCVGKDKKTALYWAVEKKHTQVVKLLLSAHADVEHSTKDGDTALLRAVRTKNADIVQMIIDRKGRVSAADKKGDTALHIAMRGRSKRIVEILLRNPKNSQMLYRPNRAGETPYNIDLSHQKTILGQIFGARRINTNEENENMLGYDLYSSSLADILSEPSLTMPISVGLYARWGSGKSFLIRKLKDEMNSFARQWVEPLFQFTPLVIMLILCTTSLLGFIAFIASGMWYVGIATGGAFFLLCVIFLVAVWFGSRSKYDWRWWSKWSVTLASQVAAFKLVAQVIFCSPPGSQWKEWKDGLQAKPLKFIFAEGAKPSSTGAGGNSVIQIMVSIFIMIEHQYGMFPTRFFRAFRPKPFSSSSPWKYRRLCGVPYIAIFFVTLGCGLALTYLAVSYGFHEASPMKTAAVVPLESDVVKKSFQDTWPTKDEDNSPIKEVRNSHQFGKRSVHDNDDEDEDDDDDDEEICQCPAEQNGYKDNRPLHGRLINPLLIILSALVLIVIVANIHTLARMFKALIFSHRSHLLSAISKFDTMSAEGYIPRLKTEVNLMVEMVRCLDAFTSQQTRLVVILDGLDTCEQEKVLSILDAVHTLFTDTSGPFIILMAIDPHIITKAIELNATKVFRESSFSGHDYLRNIIHLPFYLQNSGLRKIKLAEQAAAEHQKGRTHSAWNEQETEFVSLAMTSAMGGLHHMPVTRHMSSASELGYTMPENRRMSSESGMSMGARRTQSSRGGRRLRPSESVGSSIGSNLHRVSAASDLNKVLLTDDYFNDINPRSMRRLMNVVYITGRLLKSFHIEFNWYHLALWTNITEQWPYRASWLIFTYERKEEAYEDMTSLKDLYEKVKPLVPLSKEMEPLLEMDRDERKFETFLAMHENVLHIFNMVIFLPFTINLDPYIKKRIKEDLLQNDEKYPRLNSPSLLPWQLGHQRQDSNSSKTLSLCWNSKMPQNNPKDYVSTLPATLNPLMWGYQHPPYPHHPNTGPPGFTSQHLSHGSLPVEAQDKKLSSLSIDEVFELFEKVDGVSVNMLASYKNRFQENNINGRVLLHCNLDDLKQTLKMTFGDWELFKMLVLGLREQELSQEDDLIPRNYRFVPTHSDSGSQQHQPETMSESSDASLLTDGALIKRGSLRGSVPPKDRDDYNNSLASRRNAKLALHSKQLTMEEQMIFGALQTLNEEAYEDVHEEKAKQEAAKKITFYDEVVAGAELQNKDAIARLSPKREAEEIDVVYIQSSPLLPHTVVSSPPESESATHSVASSFSPYLGSRSLSRASSFKGGSVHASPKHSITKQSAVESREDSTRKRANSSACDPYKPTRKERPQSLHLRQVKVGGTSYVVNNIPNDVPNAEIPPEEEPHVNAGSQFSSPLNPATLQNGPTMGSLMEQLSVGSTSSLERLRKLTWRLQRALAKQENFGQAANTEDLEAAPLVSDSIPLNVAALETQTLIQNTEKADAETQARIMKSNSVESANSHFLAINSFDCETHV